MRNAEGLDFIAKVTDSQIVKLLSLVIAGKVCCCYMCKCQVSCCWDKKHEHNGRSLRRYKRNQLEDVYYNFFTKKQDEACVWSANFSD